MPNIERLRFTGSGTEATLLAIRLARAFTGRAKLVRFATNYHGWHDHAASGYVEQFDGSAAPGVLPEIAANTILVRPGDEDALARMTELHGRDIAAFIIEPVGTHFGVVPVQPQFLRAVQDAARSAGALFILDEVLSGFRVALAGAQSVYGLRPDLTTLGKILCGGMPGGAVGGRAEILDQLDHAAEHRGGLPKVLHQGTFTANPVSMAAGLAMLRMVESSDACGYANRLGARARELFNAVSEQECLPFVWYGEFSAFHLLPSSPVRSGERRAFDVPDLPMEVFLARTQPLLNRFRMALNVLGVDTNTRCSGLLGTAHSEDDLQYAADKIATAGAMLRREGYLPI
jgi:glutamate-1-semialdehyde 2,1-aminomutase